MKYFDETTSSQRKLAVGQIFFRLLVVSSFLLFQNACMVYKHAVVAAFCIYAKRGEDTAKRGGWRCALNSHGNYIVGKTWNCVFEFLLEPCKDILSK